MNNTSRYLIYASLVSLAFAVLGGLWLVWHTIEEGLALERQNRELQASLEASRIRVENFCEYPSDVLCRVDERSGTVAGALPGNIPGLDELVGAPAPVEEKSKRPAPIDASPSKALENIQKVAQAQSEVEAKANKANCATDHKPSPSPLPEPEKKQPIVKEVKVEKNVAPAPVAALAETEKASPEAMPAPIKVAPVVEVPAPMPEKNKNAGAEAQSSEKAENVIVPAPPAAVDIASPAVAPSYIQEFSGKLSDILPPKTEKTDKKQKKSASPDKKKTAKASKQATEKRMSWSRVEQDGDIFAFTITGAGESLKAKGKLLPSPWRYELELDGLFDVRQHTGIANRLVKDMKIQSRNGKTLIEFSLKAKPYKSTLHQIDARTLSVRIR